MPRAGLSRDAVVDLAVDLVDAEGRGSLTLAAVAGRAGVAVPSLYKHVGSLAELRSAVALVAVRELTRVSAAATVGRAGDDALRALGHAIRGFAHQHPGLYASGQIAPDPDAEGGLELAQSAADAVALMGAVLRGFGLPDDRTVDAVRTARSALHGFVMLEA
ncbi:MAG: TetR-like C-terminal domain-containing protein, partial [Rhodoglobus sp.]